MIFIQRSVMPALRSRGSPQKRGVEPGVPDRQNGKCAIEAGASPVTAWRSPSRAEPSSLAWKRPP